MGRRVLITGVASPLATRLALRLLEDPRVELVAGVDTRPPAPELAGRILALEADLRRPGLEHVLRRAAPDTVVHHDLVQFPEAGREARQLHDVNVVGTLQLLAACGALSTLRRLVVRGSAAIYDAGPGAPAFHPETAVDRRRLRTRWQRDVGEMEQLVEAFARRHRDVACCVLRLQPLVGRGVTTPFMELLRRPVVPTFLGFDPRIQVLHADDAVEAVAVAVLGPPVQGAVNVAGPGTVSLSLALRRLGRLELPLAPPLYGPLVRRLPGLPRLTDDSVRFLRHGRAVELTRMERDLGFRPRFSTRAALADVARERRTAAL